jgi:hypothetical protein
MFQVKSLSADRGSALLSVEATTGRRKHLNGTSETTDITIGAAQSLYADGVVQHDSGAVDETSWAQKKTQNDEQRPTQNHENRYVDTAGP